MKYLMLMLFSIVYMGSVAYGSSDCANKAKTSAFSSAGTLTRGNSTQNPGEGSR